MGRIKKSDIQKAIGDRINTNQMILCSDAHVSYKSLKHRTSQRSYKTTGKKQNIAYTTCQFYPQ